MNINDELHKLINAAHSGKVIEARLGSGWSAGFGWNPVESLEELIGLHNDSVELRAKPKTITLAGIEFPEPLRVDPLPRAAIWIADPAGGCKAFRNYWEEALCQKDWLRNGLLQVTEQGAKDQARAMILSVGGSLE